MLQCLLVQKIMRPRGVVTKGALTTCHAYPSPLAPGPCPWPPENQVRISVSPFLNSGFLTEWVGHACEVFWGQAVPRVHASTLSGPVSTYRSTRVLR